MRLSVHKAHFKRWKQGKMNNCSSFKLLEQGFDKVVIRLVEEYPCNSKQELQLREAYYIKNKPCINKNTSCLYKKQTYYQANRAKRLEYYQANRAKIAEYYQVNRVKIAVYNKQQYQSNRDKRLEYMKMYRQANRDKILA